MSLSGIQAVRLKSGDRSVITREVGRGDGSSKYFKLKNSRILVDPPIEVRINGALTSAFAVDVDNGIVTMTSAPVQDDEIEFVYYWSVYNDTEIQYFIDDNGANTTLAAAKVLLAIAADASKIAKREAMAGGGGLGSVTLDTSVVARELRNTAQAMIDNEIQLGNYEPAEGLTEVNWTPMDYAEALGQRVIRGHRS